MSQSIITTKKLRFRLLFLVFVAGLFSLSFAIPTFAKSSPADPEIVTVSKHNEPAAPLANRFALMALFAKTSYRKDITDLAERENNACNYTVTPPSDLPTTLLWKRSDKKGACYNIGGLFFETYVHTNKQGILDKAVISIRGTEATSKKDLITNLGGAIPFINYEYKAAKNNIIPLIGALKNDGIKEIYLTGHSLGGGIAQEIAYISSDVTATYTFNTSPVTRWIKMKLRGDVNVKDPTIYRVYMSKELLSHVRKITTPFNFELPNRIDYQFNFPRPLSMMDAHAMSHLACYFATQVTEDGAQFDYSKIDAEAILKNANLCPEGSI